MVSGGIPVSDVDARHNTDGEGMEGVWGADFAEIIQSA